MSTYSKNLQYYKFSLYGFFKNFRFFDAFFILFLLDKGMSYTQIGILYAIREIIINIFEIPSGIIADTYGRKNSLVASFLLFIFSFAVFYFSEDFWLFVLAFALFGIGDAFRSGTHKGMIMDYLTLNGWQDQKIDYYGHTRSWSQRGSAFSSLAAGLIVFYSGDYRSIFLYSIVPYLLNLITVASYPSVLNFSSKKKKKQSLKLTTRSFFLVIKQIKVLRIINTSAMHTAYVRAVKDYIQPLMVNVALLIPFMIGWESEKRNGLIIGVIYFFIYLLTSTASRYSDKATKFNIGNISYLSLMFGFVAGTLCGLFFMYDLWVISLIAFVLIYVIENIRKPILTGYVVDNVPNEILTSVLSAQSLLRTIMTVVLALSFGVLADHFNIGVALFSLSLILSFSTFWSHRLVR